MYGVNVDLSVHVCFSPVLIMMNYTVYGMVLLYKMVFRRC